MQLIMGAFGRKSAPVALSCDFPKMWQVTNQGSGSPGPRSGHSRVTRTEVTALQVLLVHVGAECLGSGKNNPGSEEEMKNEQERENRREYQRSYQRKYREKAKMNRTPEEEEQFIKMNRNRRAEYQRRYRAKARQHQRTYREKERIIHSLAADEDLKIKRQKRAEQFLENERLKQKEYQRKYWNGKNKWLASSDESSSLQNTPTEEVDKFVENQRLKWREYQRTYRNAKKNRLASTDESSRQNILENQRLRQREYQRKYQNAKKEWLASTDESSSRQNTPTEEEDIFLENRRLKLGEYRRTYQNAKKKRLTSTDENTSGENVPTSSLTPQEEQDQRQPLNPGIQVPWSCVATGCLNNTVSHPEKRFFSFPTIESCQRRVEWLKALHMTGAPTNRFRSLLICSDHFQTGEPVNMKEHPDYVPNLMLNPPTPEKYKVAIKEELREEPLRSPEVIAEKPIRTNHEPLIENFKIEIKEEPIDAADIVGMEKSESEECRNKQVDEPSNLEELSSKDLKPVDLKKWKRKIRTKIRSQYEPHVPSEDPLNVSCDIIEITNQSDSETESGSDSDSDYPEDSGEICTKIEIDPVEIKIEDS